MRQVAAIALLSLLFGSAGILHFTRPASFASIVPPWLPAPALLVVVSGIAEVAGACGLAIPATRRAAGYGLIALLVAVFPANVQMLTSAMATSVSNVWKALLWLRLPVQPLLIWLVWWVAIKRRPVELYE